MLKPIRSLHCSGIPSSSFFHTLVHLPPGTLIDNDYCCIMSCKITKLVCKIHLRNERRCAKKKGAQPYFCFDHSMRMLSHSVDQDLELCLRLILSLHIACANGDGSEPSLVACTLSNLFACCGSNISRRPNSVLNVQE